jgi:hypothetical protein
VVKEQWDVSRLPIYGCLTGIELPEERVAILPGVALRRVYVDTIGATMMAFAPPPTPKSPHPAPWAAVRGGFTFEGRTEVELTNTAMCDGLTPSVTCWLIAALLRLRVPTPIRLALIGNMPFDQMGRHWQTAQAIAFESAPNQRGVFSEARAEASADEISWLSDMLPVAARLYHDERFFRAFPSTTKPSGPRPLKWQSCWSGPPWKSYSI